MVAKSKYCKIGLALNYVKLKINKVASGNILVYFIDEVINQFIYAGVLNSSLKHDKGYGASVRNR